MKIKITYESLDEGERHGILVEINNKLELSVYDGEPEDNSLTRNFSDIYKLHNMLKAAYEAGKNGEELIIEEVDE